MTEEQLNLLEELKQTEEYSSAILGTYSFGGDFFEDEVLTRLQRLGIRNTTVLTDTEEYKTTDNGSTRNSSCCLVTDVAIASSAVRI